MSVDCSAILHHIDLSVDADLGSQRYTAHGYGTARGCFGAAGSNAITLAAALGTGTVRRQLKIT